MSPARAHDRRGTDRVRGAGRRGARRPVGEEGQATVELALLLPFVCGLVLLVIQVALAARAQVLLTVAARETARAAMVEVDPSPAIAAGRAATRLDRDRLTLAVEPMTGAPLVAIHARYRLSIGVPLLGLLHRDVELATDVVVHAEAP
jgi:hypothetical protein